MEFDDDQPGLERDLKYDFSGAKAGQSVWLATHAARVNASQAFDRWRERTQSPLTSTTRKVGSEDRKGAGFRLYIHAQKIELPPSVLARMPRIEALQSPQIVAMQFTGIDTNDDVITAAMSCDPMPAGVTEANAVRKMILAGETPYQIEYSTRVHGMTLAEKRSEAQQRVDSVDAEDAQRRAEAAERLEQAKLEEAAAMAGLEQEEGYF